MKGEPKKKKIPGLIRVALADNVRQLMEEKYRMSPNKPRALAKDAGVGLYTVQRLLDASTGANLDTIEAVGKVFKVEAYELLTPLFAKRRISVTTDSSGKQRVVPLRQRRTS